MQLPGGAAWVPVRTNFALPAGAVVRTGPASRALVRLSSESALRMDERSLLQLRAPPPKARNGLIELLRGGLYFFHRDPPTDTQFRTPLVAGAIRGTEFALRVDDEGGTTLDLIEGQVSLANDRGAVELTRAERATVEPGGAPRVTARLEATNIIQWCLYYPAVVNLDDLPLAEDSRQALASSLEAYRDGDVPGALALYPPSREPVSSAERVYRAALVLAAGQVSTARGWIDSLSPGRPADAASEAEAAAAALRTLMAAIVGAPDASESRPDSSSGFLAESYRLQARLDLKGALAAARSAAEAAPRFGFAWVRVAELEFGFGRADRALHALQRARELSPRHAPAAALEGFALAARGQTMAAEVSFERALTLDSAFAEGWLGRGLCRIRRGATEVGREDLLVAAAVEPTRAVLRSYLGKAFTLTGDSRHAQLELERAVNLDPRDPTAWLYRALLKHEENRVGEAIRDLEQSRDLNGRRALFRSRLMLDQDLAVRGANLAALYRDAGMPEVARRRAAAAVQEDYANSSAHLFLAESYGALLDPAGVNLRHETVAFSELTVANLLSPATAGVLSRGVSLQEYSPLFERDGPGIASSTEYRSAGDWEQRVFQYGLAGRASYALDAGYRSVTGERPNQDLRLLDLAAAIKVQATSRDTLTFQAFGSDLASGDRRQYYLASEASRSLRVVERQEPNVLAGWHREWAPGVRTLALVGRLEDEFALRQEDVWIPTVLRDAGGPFEVTVPAASEFGTQEQSKFVAYTGELQNVVQWSAHTVIAGARFQTGETKTRFDLAGPASTPFAYEDGRNLARGDLRRFSLYAYDHWQVLARLWLTPGVTYDQVRVPANSDLPPVRTRLVDRELVSPKVALTWTPHSHLTMRGAYARSLGGLIYDSSVRLEPTQLAGFNQVFRSLAPESVAGTLAGAEFEVRALGWDWRNSAGTYLGVEAEGLESRGHREVGMYAVDFSVDPGTAVATASREDVRFVERSLVFDGHQRLGDDWFVGLLYRLSASELHSAYPTLAGTPASAFFAPAHVDTEALLQQIQLASRCQFASGLFAEGQAIWTRQSDVNVDYRALGVRQRLGDEDFWQFNLWAGWRLARRRVEWTAGLLNLADANYRLHPVSVHADLPRSRTLVIRLRLNF